MDACEPHFVADTDGVHFLVCVDDQFVQSYVGRAVREKRWSVRNSESSRRASELELR